LEKGIDITANVITSVIVALIGLAFWRAKLWLDLHAERAKRKQEYAMTDERERQKKQEAAAQHEAELQRELSSIVAAAGAASDANVQRGVWSRYSLFVEVNHLESMPGNLNSLTRRLRFEQDLHYLTSTDVYRRDEMVRIIKDTQLPSTGLAEPGDSGSIQGADCNGAASRP